MSQTRRLAAILAAEVVGVDAGVLRRAGAPET
jgi:hypothetical protein